MKENFTWLFKLISRPVGGRVIDKNNRNAISSNMISIFLLFFLFLIQSIPVNAQSNGIVKGKITDASTGEPLLGANVLIVEQQTGGTANKDGEFQISLKPGKYTLQVSYIGYKPIKEKIVIIANKTLVKNFMLKTDLIGTSEVVVLGTRRKDRTVIESTVPIDVLPAEVIEENGVTQTTEMLKMLVPSYDAPENTITDGSDFVRPASLRGLGPDQLLVLVNGKRRYPSALVNLNGSIGRGSSGTDLNAIPAADIQSIEVLRDGASAQYGSDAIAGVINVILKKRIGLDASASVGEYNTDMKSGYALNEGLVPGQNASTYPWAGKVNNVHIQDGLSTALHLGYGFNVLKTGSIYIAGDFRRQNYTNRAGEDPRQQYFTADSANEASFNRLDSRYGQPALSDAGFMLNSTIPLNDNLNLYASGDWSYRSGLSAELFRRPMDNNTLRAFYPNGFLPLLSSKIYDGSFSAGLKGDLGGWAYDLSETYGGNSFNYYLKNSVNVSMGTASPTQFYCGTLKFYQSTTNLDLVNAYNIGTASQLNVAAGLEFRWENYQQVQGEPASYINGGVPILDGPSAGKPAPAGAQGFPGYTPNDAVNGSRTNVGLYLDLENDVITNWTWDVAGRFENYSDFGSTVAGKISTRYQFFKGFALRGSISNGFRAPALQQEYYSAISTVLINGQFYQVGTFPVATDAAKALGAKKLTAEKSVNISAGATYTVNNFLLTVDGYQITVIHRIGLSENFVNGKIPAFLESRGIDATGGRYFTNALNTKTNGVDITSSYGIRLGEKSTLKLTVAMNFNKTEVTNANDVLTPPELAAYTTIPLQSRNTIGRLTVGYPKSSWNFMANYNWEDFGLALKVLRYGQTQSLSSTDPLYDQTYNPLWVTNLEVSYNISKGIAIAAGCNNLFDVYPNKINLNGSYYGIMEYSSFSPSGFNGRYIYSRLNVSL